MSLRLFVALELPAAVRAALVAFRDEVADPAVWRPLDAEALHVTLAFLGRRPEEDVARVRAVLAGLAGLGAAPAGAAGGGPDAPALALADALLLPPRRARVLCAELADPRGALAALQAAVAGGLAAAGVHEPEARPFRAHVTVARLRAGARAPRAVAGAPAPLAFRPPAVTLYSSVPGRGGARYTPLVRRTLAGGER